MRTLTVLILAVVLISCTTQAEIKTYQVWRNVVDGSLVTIIDAGRAEDVAARHEDNLWVQEQTEQYAGRRVVWFAYRSRPGYFQNLMYPVVDFLTFYKLTNLKELPPWKGKR